MILDKSLQGRTAFAQKSKAIDDQGLKMIDRIHLLVGENMLRIYLSIYYLLCQPRKENNLKKFFSPWVKRFSPKCVFLQKPSSVLKAIASERARLTG